MTWVPPEFDPARLAASLRSRLKKVAGVTTVQGCNTVPHFQFLATATRDPYGALAEQLLAGAVPVVEVDGETIKVSIKVLV